MKLSEMLAKIEDRLEQAVSITLGEPYGEIEVYSVDARRSNIIKVEFRVVGCQRHYEWTFDSESLADTTTSSTTEGTDEN